MIRYFGRRLYELASEKRRLQRDYDEVFAALCTANRTAEQALTRCQQLERDNTLLVMMARDSRAAAAVIATAHDIDRLGTA